MSLQVFISYSTKDMPVVERFRSILQGSCIKAFVAEHAVVPGEPVAGRISNAIKACDLFVLLWSRNSRGSEWVSQEIGIAVGTGRPIIPVLLDGETAPGFLRGIKCLPAARNTEDALLAVRRYLFDRAEKKQQAESLVWLGIGAGLLFALSRSE